MVFKCFILNLCFSSEQNKPRNETDQVVSLALALSQYFEVLDAAKCADVVLCVVGPHASLEDRIDRAGAQLVSAVAKPHVLQEPAFDDLGYKTLTVGRLSF